ncbi:DinB family protein [Paenibacillus sp. GXUN7292]|uniref:DinB family protein n=1 Tax=Paenibacillus sp. GXUN7292 TaxID=3422499 RepID=UPI003D7CECE7
MSHLRIDSYLNTYSQLTAAIQNLSEEQLKWKPAPASWSILEVLTHLVDHSIVISFRARDVLAATENRLPIFGQDEWVSGQYANEGKAEDVLSVYNSLLQYNSLLFARLGEEDWNKSAANFKGDQVSVASIIDGFAAHVQNHLGQISRIKSQL